MSLPGEEGSNNDENSDKVSNQSQQGDFDIDIDNISNNNEDDETAEENDDMNKENMEIDDVLSDIIHHATPEYNMSSPTSPTYPHAEGFKAPPVICLDDAEDVETQEEIDLTTFPASANNTTSSLSLPPSLPLPPPREKNYYLYLDDNDRLEHCYVAQLPIESSDPVIFSPRLHWKSADWDFKLMYQSKFDCISFGINALNFPTDWELNIGLAVTLFSTTDEVKLVEGGSTIFSGNDCGKEISRFLPMHQLREEFFDLVRNEEYVKLKVSLRAKPFDTFLPRMYNSKKATGMVGLENLGATCYLNALLQMLYHISAFREAIYMAPIPQDGRLTTTLGLQLVFSELQFGIDTASIRSLTEAFGWRSFEQFQQQDVQEMLRIFIDKLEECTKGTNVDSLIKNLFCGKIKSFINCLNIDYKSEREEEFYDIQLDVKGCQNIEESFIKYTTKEILNGENQYDAEGNGKQDAEKGVIFTHLPPVLTIHLKRFEFDVHRMGFVKIHDRYKFGKTLNLNQFVEKKDDSEDHTYILHSVLIHGGETYGGHYYAFIRPFGDFWVNPNDYNIEPAEGVWYKFDDEHVVQVNHREAVEMTFGKYNGESKEENLLDIGTHRSAYMLVYVKESEIKNVMKRISEDNVPKVLRDAAANDKKRREEEEFQGRRNHWLASVSYVLEEDVANFRNYSYLMDFIDEGRLHSYRTLTVVKHCTGLGFLMCLARELNVHIPQIRLYCFEQRENDIYRIEDSFTFEDLSFMRFKDIMNKTFYVHIIDKDEIHPEILNEMESVLTLEAKLRHSLSNEFNQYFGENFDQMETCIGIGRGQQILEAILNSLTQERSILNNLELLSKKLLYSLKNVNQTKHSLIFFKIFDPSRELSSIDGYPFFYIGSCFVPPRILKSNLYRRFYEVLATKAPRLGFNLNDYKDHILLYDLISPQTHNLIEYDEEAFYEACIGDVVYAERIKSDQLTCKEWFSNIVNTLSIELSPYRGRDKDICLRKVGLWTRAQNIASHTFHLPETEGNNQGTVVIEANRFDLLSTFRNRVAKFIGVSPERIILHTRTEVQQNRRESKKIQAPIAAEAYDDVETFDSLFEREDIELLNEIYLSYQILPFPQFALKDSVCLDFRIVDQRLKDIRNNTFEDSLENIDQHYQSSLYSLLQELDNQSHHPWNATQVVREIRSYHQTHPNDPIVNTPDEFFELNEICLLVSMDDIEKASDLIDDLTRKIDERLTFVSYEGSSICYQNRKRKMNERSHLEEIPRKWTNDGSVSSDNNSGGSNLRLQVPLSPSKSSFTAAESEDTRVEKLQTKNNQYILLLLVLRKEGLVASCLPWETRAISLASWDYVKKKSASEPYGLQMFTTDEIKCITARGPDAIRCILVSVYSFELYGQVARPVSTQYGGFITYVLENDTYESFYRRLSEMTGTTFTESTRLAVIQHQIAHFLQKDVSPTSPRNSSNNSSSQQESEGELTPLEGPIWRRFQEFYAEFISQYHNNFEIIYNTEMLPVLGIQISAVKNSHSGSNNQSSRYRSGIKI